MRFVLHPPYANMQDAVAYGMGCGILAGCNLSIILLLVAWWWTL